MNGHLRQFCVFGNPIEHSKSPLLYNFAFSSFSEKLPFLGFYGRYLLHDNKKNDGDKLISQTFFKLKLSGANITVPFKEIAYKECDEVKGIAKQIGAVNTIVLKNKDNKNTSLIGYNTDAEGFYQTISSHNFKTALIIGAGGSAKAIACVLRQKNIKVTILNRSKNRLGYFIQNNFECFLSQDFKPASFDLIVNATTAGLRDETLPISKDLLKPLLLQTKMAYDLIYGVHTPFLNLAKELEIAYTDGKDMLIQQAVLAFGHFCDNKIPALKIYEKMRRILE